MRPTPEPFATPESGQAAIREALDAIAKMERDARERRERSAKRDERKPHPQETTVQPWNREDENPRDEDWRITDEEE